jgi:hypothetical protein
LGAGHGSRRGRHGRLGKLLLACRERAPGGVLVNVHCRGVEARAHGAGKGIGMGRSDGGGWPACLLEEEVEGGGKGEQQQGRELGGHGAPARWLLLPWSREEEGCWRLKEMQGWECKIAKCKGRGLLFIGMW